MPILTSDQTEQVVALDDCVRECFRISVAHGFWDHLDTEDTRNYVPEKVALAHTELSEVIKADRTGELIEEERQFEILHELADTVIRVFDLAAVVQCTGSYSISPKYDSITFGRILVEKMITNDSRPRLHNKRY